MIDSLAIQSRFDAVAPFLDERSRRLVAASEARAAGRGGVTAVAIATGVARSTIDRGLAELRIGCDMCAGRIRRPGGGRKPAVETQPGLLDALRDLVQSAIRGDPQAALLWVSKSQRHLGRCAGRLRLLGQPQAGGTVAAPTGLQPAGQSQDARRLEPSRSQRPV
jgi:hypothetical protein